ncbi:MAG: GUN4 domain-containing protein [Nostocales cyanobacterium 94392]|nr:GUN4 domain-containing protein [Nostocales cyanobacterium 94392]
MVQTILILAANPKDTKKLRLDEEVREIEAGLERAKNRDQFILEDKLAVRPRDIQRAMLDLNPQIVHFSGHGEEDEGLIFEDETGQTKLVDGEALAELFKLFPQVECVVLNGCYSEVQAIAIAKQVNYVIGMKKAIGDKAAIEFAVGFYDALLSGRPVEFAYKLGCAAIGLAGIPEQLTPILKKKLDIENDIPANSTPIPDLDYRQLETFLTSRKWKQADDETLHIMKLAVGRAEPEDCLTKEDFENFPCDVLQKIDQLWTKHSKHHFGFSVQKEIWQSTEINYDFLKFMTRLGWGWEETSQYVFKGINLIDFDLSAPKGLLPLAVTYYGGNFETRKKYISMILFCFSV